MKLFQFFLEMTRRQRILWICTLLCMFMIFTLSGQPASESSQVSLGTTDFILSMVVSDYRTLSPEEQEQLQSEFNGVVRGLGHFAEYTLLGALLYGALLDYAIDEKRRAGGALLGSVLYAGTDEIHQLFVEGRACQLQDLCVDALGAAFGIACIFVCCLFFKRLNHSVASQSVTKLPSEKETASDRNKT